VLAAAEVGNRLSKDEFKAVVPDLRVGLLNAQFDLRTAEFPVIIFIAGDDRTGSADVVRRLHEWMDARYIDTTVLGDPRPEEAERPRLWRLWRAMPPHGRTAIWAGGLLRQIEARVAGQIDDATLDAWTGHLEALQAALLADGALVIKLFLHTPAAEQRARLETSGDRTGGWRVDARDWEMLETISDAWPLVERFLHRTSAPGAPWTIIEATDARYRDVTAARTILDALTARLAHAPPEGPSAPVEMFSPRPNQPTVLSRVDLSPRLSRSEYRERLDKLQARLHDLAVRAREGGLPVVLVFEGWDAAGKGGVIRRCTAALEVGDYRVIPVGAPTPEELRYPYMWRFWRDLPSAGQVVIFDRSWYGRVLVERVEGLASPAMWQRAYDEINDFERQLVEAGCLIQKFWLHISSEEQLARFEARERTPYKKYKMTAEDYRNRERWGDYERAVDQMVLRTSTEAAPWHLVSAEDKQHARVEVLRTITAGLKQVLRGDARTV
jgi:polyphosphate:AMP phosphotransferase